MNHLPLFILLLVFIISLVIVLASSSWFTTRLETLSDIFDLSDSLLSLLGALGANIPNYFASIVSIAHGELTVGLGIIVGSNIYNIAIILSISVLATPGRQGIILTPKEARDGLLVASYTLAILGTTLISIWLLAFAPLANGLHPSPLLDALLIVVTLLGLGTFSTLSYHAFHRAHAHVDSDAALIKTKSILPLALQLRYIGEVMLALGIALGGVVVMVQSGQAFASAVHMPDAILGLVVLAVATSLPNTVVAFGLARTHRGNACVEEIFSSNSINASLGIMLPLLFWHSVFHDAILTYLDTPLMLLLTGWAMVCVCRKRVSRLIALLLLLIYISWLVLHLLVR